ncbi:MAG TPA: 5-formyltetrahydrofolate cyclo-ligase [Flavobacteriales bacterium]|nr:5-formyltetrahydrofolate cyclo-ligase [Flavobacteriales bacterium]HCA83726.1 5-formyltetrahydrofolate cyclo-ligase [Flavobacteriales bacterium]HRE75227.1 5-formyltetrahydrofolate cyclo-ligase [Flavobacteriales bacterium]HRE97847.1 5-formyltetrahydrofolate cyclo-ligase [Flavobacteriales bacterium]HRJ35490.1 5-formyltetrahydrofolate cyclo-ligase [Flavobacteriales bacterium]
MVKEELRIEYLERMRSLTTGQVEDSSQSLASLFFREFPLYEECVSIFLSITRNNEINTFYFINQLQREFPGVQLAVPVSDFSSGTMTHRRYHLHTTLKINKLGIPEPIDGEVVEASCFDLVLVPLLCFDKNGSRVGYGKGFYDRFLSTCRPQTQKIGLSLFPPVELIEDTNAHDIRLDAVITPGEIFRFN